MRPTDIERFMDLALAEAKNAELLNDVPIGAIVVNNEKTIIGRGFNQTESRCNPVAHAEILAIEDAAKQNRDWRLNNFILFSTIEPCPMCKSAAAEARINRIYYGSENSQMMSNKKECIQTNLRNIDCSKILKKFFKKLR
jgi:tRNA(adenine34) deaminase